MTPTENLHYAIGELAYTMAYADGKVQEKERQKFHDMVAAELRCKDYAFDVSDIIFQIMDKDRQSTETVYNWALKIIKTNSHYLSPELKATFIKVMEKVAKAYPPVTQSESDLLERFKKDIASIHGDPVYYEKH
jgi:uncharacterized tellurite resistance protein B-like protein